jgi:hypothetical protein
MLSLNGMRHFGINLIIKSCGFSLKWTISYHLGWCVINGIRVIIVIGQLEMGERAQAYESRQRGCLVPRRGDCDVLHCLKREKDDVFI